jgi:ribosomal protein S27AE
MKRKDEHDFIYDNGDDSGIDYSDLSESEDPEDVIAELRETLGKGPCPKCGKTEMVPDGKGYCYYCLECGYAENQDAYLRDLAGYPVEYED